MIKSIKIGNKTFKPLCPCCRGENFNPLDQCDLCGRKYKWVRNRFKFGDKVLTEFGVGTIVGIDLPYDNCWRWIVFIEKKDAIKDHGCISREESMAFFDKEVKEIINKN